MPEQLVTFTLDDEHYGIDVTQVQEILRTRSLTPVPLAHPAVMGLLNLRGQIVTVIDPKTCLGRSSGPASDQTGMNVVARAASGVVSLRVDSVGDVLDVDPARVEPAVDAPTAAGRELVSGLYKLDDKLLHILSVDKLADFRSQRDRT